jgi:hypothetical protein
MKQVASPAWFVYSSALKMEAIFSSETTVNFSVDYTGFTSKKIKRFITTAMRT